MKIMLIFLILIVFSSCALDEAKIEEIRQRRLARMKVIADCILKNEKTSDTLRKSIEENKDGDIMRAIHPRGQRLEKSDKDLIRECRKESIRAIHDDFRRMEEEKIRERHHHHHHDHPHPHPNDL